MMEQFQRCVETKCNQTFIADQRRIRYVRHCLLCGKVYRPRCIRCLAHIVNLATQAVIKATSAAPLYNLHEPESHIPDLDTPIDGSS